MITTKLIYVIVMVGCLSVIVFAEPPSTSYLPSSFQMSQHSFQAPQPSFGLTAPSAFSSSFSGLSNGYSAPAPAANYGVPKPVYVTPKPVYSAPPAPPPARKYLPSPFKLPTTYSAPAPAPAPLPAPLYGAPRHQEDYHSEPAHYEYHYDVQDPHYGTDFGHKEERQGDVTHGRYMVLLPDGRRQIVEYVADKNGYRPTIRYEGEVKTHIGGGGGGYP